MKAAILLNGEAPDFSVEKILDGRFVVCADGAYNWASKKNIKIDMLVGDFDSIDKNIDDIKDKIEIKSFKRDKNETDGQICLDILLEKNYDDIVFLGGGGKRDDHFFACFGLLYRALKRKADCVFYTNTSDIYITGSVFKRKVERNKILSLVPFFESVHIIYTKGLKYKLTEHTLFADQSLGISNVVDNEDVEIKVKNGVALIFVVKYQ